MGCPKPSAWQIYIASNYGIPSNQAHTVNPEKVHAYLNHCQSDECRLEWFMNNISNRHSLRDQREWM